MPRTTFCISLGRITQVDTSLESCCASCSKPVAAAVCRVSERCPSGRFLSPVTGSALRAFERIVCALTSSGHRPQRLGQAGNPLQPHPLPDSSKRAQTSLRALLRLVEIPALPDKQRSAVDMTIHVVQSSAPQRPQDGAAPLTLVRDYAYMGARKLRIPRLGGRMSWSAS